MKNNIFKLFILVSLVTMFFSLISFNKVVKADTTYSGFKDFSFVVNRKIKYTGAELVWNVSITWKTEEEIKYLEVEMILEDGHKEAVYIDGRDNLANKNVIKEENYYIYTLEFDINSNDELQGIELIFTYSYVDEIPSMDDLIIKNYLLSTGHTNYDETLSIWACLLIGVIISISAAVSTFIIIQNTKVDLIKLKNDSEDDESYECPEE